MLYPINQRGRAQSASGIKLGVESVEVAAAPVEFVNELGVAFGRERWHSGAIVRTCVRVVNPPFCRVGKLPAPGNPLKSGGTIPLKTPSKSM